MQGHELPDGWCFRPLSEIADIVSGGTPSTENPRFWENGTIPWATPTDITKNGDRVLRDTAQRITVEGLRNSSARLLPPRTLLMTSRATLGEVKVALEAVSTNQGFKSLTPKEDVDVWFLYYQMLFNKSRYTKLGIGSTFLEVNKKETEKFAILLAPKSEQRQIAAILIALDDCIENTHSLIAKYNAIKQGMIQDLFTRGVDDRGNLRPPHSESPKNYYETALGYVPRGWKIRELSEVCTYQTGKAFPSSQYCDEGIPLLRPGNLQKDEYVAWDKAHTICLPHFWANAAKDYLVIDHELVMNLTAQSLEEDFLGRVCLTGPNTKCLLNQRIARFRTKACVLDFLFWAFKAPSFRFQIDRLTQGTKVQHLYNTNLNSIMMAIPNNLSEQEKISEKLFSVSAMIKSEEATAQKLAYVKSGFMQDLLTGKVRVKLDESTGNTQDVGVPQS
jgi:type I restriction enzyme, S subunit